MPHFESIPRIWAIEQRRGVTFNITDAASHTDHVEKATREPFRLSEPAPLPPEVKAAADYHSRTPDSEVLSSWKSQIRRLKDLVTACDPMQAEWGRMTPDSIRGASSGVGSVALIRLMSQFGLGGSRWVNQLRIWRHGDILPGRHMSNGRENDVTGLGGAPLYGRISQIRYQS